jgi:WD40 repeat protein
MRAIPASSLLLAILGGCAETPPNTPEPTTSLAVTVLTTGDGTRPTGYTLRVDSESAHPIPAAGTVTFGNLAPGSHTVTLEGVPDQCITDWVEPQPVALSAVEPGTASFRVHCVVPIRGEMSYARGVLPDNYRELWTVRLDGSGARSLGVRDGILSPQGTLIAHHVPDGETRVTSVDGVIDVTIGPRYTGPLAWSPDGRHVALSSNPLSLTIARADGRGSRTLSGIGNGVFSAAAWSPDGRELAMIDFGAVRVLNVATGALRTLQRTSGSTGVSWSPNGDRLAFFSEQQAGRYRLVTLRPDGADERIVVTDVPQGFALTWSPDGGSFLFSAAGLPGASASALLDLFSVATDGTGIRNLTQTPSVNEWSGRLIP